MGLITVELRKHVAGFRFPNEGQSVEEALLGSADYRIFIVPFWRFADVNLANSNDKRLPASKIGIRRSAKKRFANCSTSCRWTAVSGSYSNIMSKRSLR